MNDLSKACLDEAKNSMQSSLGFLEKELAKIRAGKANPGMLDGVKVDYYGTMTEISQVANINTPDARSIVIQPWEKTIVGAINKAILDANLGFTPRHEGDILRIVIPPLTEERRKELCKQAKTEVENAKVNVRNVRRKVMDEVKKLTKKEYFVRGCTALLDAVGGAIHHIGNIHKYARPEDVPEHTIFVITTDGLENASRRYGSDKVKRMIERQKEKYGWEFLFLGANIDAVETAEHIGISRNRAANYRADGEGTAHMFGAMAKAVSSMRCSVALKEDWAAELEEDAKRR